MPESESPTDEPRKRLWITLLRPKVAIPLAMFILLLLSPVLYRGWNLAHIPDPGDPFPAELLEKPDLPEEENAWVNYQRAETLRSFPNPKTVIIPSVSRPFISGIWESEGDVERIKIWDSGRRSGKDTDNNIARLNSWIEALRDNNDALVEWKAGTEKSKYIILDDSVQTLEASHYSMSFYPKFAALDSQSLAKAGQLASQGEYSAALDWILAVYRYSRHLTQSGGTKNWERAIKISQRVFAALDELLDDEAYSHAELIAFLHKLEASRELTGEFEQALRDDSLALRQKILNAHESAAKYREEFEAGSFVEAGSSVFEKSRFELYVAGEPQLSLRVLRHHFEYLKRNLEKPVEDRVTPLNLPYLSPASLDPQLERLYRENFVSHELAVTPDRMEEYFAKAGLLREVVEPRDFFTNPFLREDDRMLFESLRILIAAHAFARRFPHNSDRHNPIPFERLPVASMDELVADSLGETPRDPYRPASKLVIATSRHDEVLIFSSASVKHAHLVNGEPLESIEVSDDWLPYVVHQPIFLEEPQFKSLSFRLRKVPARDLPSDGNRHPKGIHTVPVFDE